MSQSKPTIRYSLAERALAARLVLAYLDRDADQLATLFDDDPTAATRALLAIVVAEAVARTGNIHAARGMFEAFAAVNEAEQIVASVDAQTPSNDTPPAHTEGEGGGGRIRRFGRPPGSLPAEETP